MKSSLTTIKTYLYIIQILITMSGIEEEMSALSNIQLTLTGGDQLRFLHRQ